MKHKVQEIFNAEDGRVGCNAEYGTQLLTRAEELDGDHGSQRGVFEVRQTVTTHLRDGAGAHLQLGND
jgi:hypothetical protein